MSVSYELTAFAWWIMGFIVGLLLGWMATDEFHKRKQRKLKGGIKQR